MMDKVINKEYGSENVTRAMSFQCIDAIELSLFIEKEGLNFYEKAAKRVSDPRVQDMFLRLAEEERNHIQTLQTKIQFLQPVIPRKRENLEIKISFINEMIKDKIFPSFETEKMQKYKSDIEVLEYGIESEKHSINILNELLENEKKLDVKAIFSHLIVEEKKHLALLENLKEKF